MEISRVEKLSTQRRKGKDEAKDAKEKQRIVMAHLEDACSKKVIGAAIEVHRALGPGLLESAHERALPIECDLRSIRFERQLDLPARYKGQSLGDSYRLDFLIEDLIIVEGKAVRRIEPVHESQLLTYLRLSERKLGLLLNFHSNTMRDGIRRIVNNL